MPEEIKVEPGKVAEPIQSAQTKDDIIRKPGVNPIEEPSPSAKKTPDEVEGLKNRISSLEKDVEGKQGRIDSLTAEKYDLKDKATQVQTQTPTRKWEELSLKELKEQRALARKDPESTEEEIDQINDLIHEKIAVSKANTEVGTAKSNLLKQQAGQTLRKEMPELFNADYTFNKTCDIYKEFAKAYGEFPETVKNDPQALLKIGRLAKERLELKKLQDINKQNTLDEDHEKNGLEASGVKTVEADNLTKLQQAAEAEVLSGNKTGPAGRAYLKALEKKQ